MAIFHPFLDAQNSRFPDLAADAYRIATFVGVLEEDRLFPGPALDTDRLEDVQALLMLLGVALEAMQPISRSDGRASRGAWLKFDPILAINDGIVFAVGDVAARDFLLDLKAAAEMAQSISSEQQGGCMLQIVMPAALA